MITNKSGSTMKHDNTSMVNHAFAKCLWPTMAVVADRRSSAICRGHTKCRSAPCNPYGQTLVWMRSAFILIGRCSDCKRSILWQASLIRVNTGSENFCLSYCWISPRSLTWDLISILMSWLGNKIAGLPISSRILELEPQTRDLFTSVYFHSQSCH